MAENKITQKSAIQYVLDNYGETMPVDVVAKFNSMLESLDKRANAPRNPSASVIENKGLREAILNTMEPNTLYSINDLIRKVPGLENASSHKVSALLTPLKREGLILRIEDKRKAYFKLA